MGPVTRGAQGKAGTWGSMVNIVKNITTMRAEHSIKRGDFLSQRHKSRGHEGGVSSPVHLGEGGTV